MSFSVLVPITRNRMNHQSLFGGVVVKNPLILKRKGIYNFNMQGIIYHNHGNLGEQLTYNLHC